MAAELRWLTSLDEAIEVARSERKIVLADYVKPGCAGCEAMDAVSYPDPSIASELEQHFVTARIDIVADRAAARVARVLWTPTLVFWSRHRVWLRDSIGFLPADALLLQLRFVRALDALRSGQYDPAQTLFGEVAEHPNAADLAPEAFYWRGIAGYLRDYDEERLHQVWEPLRARWPDSLWTTRTRYGIWA